MYTYPYTKDVLTRLIVIGYNTKSAKYLNQLPSLSSILTEISQNTMITGKLCPDYRHVSEIDFGDYVQVYRRRGGNKQKPGKIG